jgi:hypothetical protein
MVTARCNVYHHMVILIKYDIYLFLNKGDKEVKKNVKDVFLSMCDVKIFLTFTSPNMVHKILVSEYKLFKRSNKANLFIALGITLSQIYRNESGRFGALKSDSTLHFFRNACTKSGSLRFSQFSGC